MLRSQIQKAAYLAGLAVLAATVSVGAARASTITVFSNFGTGYSFNTNGARAVTGSTYGDVVEAMPFTAGSTADLADAILALGYAVGYNTPITLDLESNSSSDVPGTILATLMQVGTIRPGTSPGTVTFDYTGTTSVELTSGTSYWVVALQTHPDSYDEWFYSNSDTGTSDYNTSGSATGPWAKNSGQPYISASQVDGIPVPTVPEPGSFLLLTLVMVFGLGALGLGAFREKRSAISRQEATKVS